MATDNAAIFDIHSAAFGRPDEARLVDGIAADGDMLVSLLAEIDGQAVGHVAFSAMVVIADDRHWRCAALAPLGVVPQWQRRGVGTALIEAGLRILQAETYAACFVLGEPGLYRRFGFDPALARPFVSPFAGPHFMARYLDSAPAIPQSGRAEHAPAFARLDRP